MGFVPGGAVWKANPCGGRRHVRDRRAAGPALDAKTGLSIWCAPRTNGLGVQRMRWRGPRGTPSRRLRSGRPQSWWGRPPLGDRLFYTSDDAYIVCLNRLTGAVMWTRAPGRAEREGPVYTSASLDRRGRSGDHRRRGRRPPMRGFLVAYHVNTGKEAWRFYTIPKPGEPLSETWLGRALETGGGATWHTAPTIRRPRRCIWAVGNPYPDTQRPSVAGPISIPIRWWRWTSHRQAEVVLPVHALRPP